MSETVVLAIKFYILEIPIKQIIVIIIKEFEKKVFVDKLKRFLLTLSPEAYLNL